ncbi:MAG: inositol monophosphatase family protein [Gammaproteobacteria bacterium]|nr:inositol monophosphatase family protein [Gammaproteobacteria bacterium]
MTVDPRASLNAKELQRLLDAALSLSDLCREVIADAVSEGVDVNAKIDRSLVTNADLAAERAFRERLGQRFPDMGVQGEEFGGTNPDSPWQWVIDPVDGTSDFARGIPIWGSIIGLFFHGEPVVGVIDHPPLGLRLHAAFGQGAYRGSERLSLSDYDSGRNDSDACVGLPSRSNFIRRNDDGAAFDALAAHFPDFRVFRSCLTHAYAATGQLDVALEWDVNLWDVAATRIIVEEAGGRYILLRKRAHSEAGMLYCAVFGRPALADRIAAMLSAHI